jgi:tetratricopeptide (TPR) repeat protein
MIYNIIVISAVVIIFLILARRVPKAIEEKEKDSKEFTPQEITTASLMAQADDAFSGKDFSKSEKLYLRAAAQNPDNAKVYTRLGIIYLERKNYYDAKDAFLQAVKIDPDIALRRVNLGLAYMGLKDYYKAYEQYKKALDLDPKNKKYQILADKAYRAYERDKKRKK